MIKFKEFIDEFKKGYQTHSKVREIAKKYGKGCEGSTKELDEAGIPYSEWERMHSPGLSLKNIAYSLGGQAFWIKSGMPSSLFE